MKEIFTIFAYIVNFYHSNILTFIIVTGILWFCFTKLYYDSWEAIKWIVEIEFMFEFIWGGLSDNGLGNGVSVSDIMSHLTIFDYIILIIFCGITIWLFSRPFRLRFRIEMEKERNKQIGANRYYAVKQANITKAQRREGFEEEKEKDINRRL